MCSSDLVNTGNVYGEGWPPRNVFGWVELNNLNNNLTMITNAVSYDSGIIVGTTQPVPEPNTVVLFIIGLVICAVKYYGIRT